MYEMKNLHLRLTSKCNKNCRHCFAKIDSESNDLPLDYWLGIVNVALSLGLQNVTLTGGEPFLYDQIDDLIRNIKVLPCSFSIETNGLLLKEHFATLLDSENIRKIAISPDLDYKDNYMHEMFENCKILLENNIVPLIQTVILPHNFKKAKKWFDCFEKEGISCRVILGNNKLGRSKKLLENLDFASMMDIYNSINGYSFVKCNLPPLITNKNDDFSCGWNINRADILPNGDFTTCATIAWNDPSFILGYVDESNLADVWYNNVTLNKWRRLTEKDYGGKCNNCKHFSICKGSCIAVSLGYKGNALGGYPLCEEYSEKMKESGNV